MPLVLLPHHDHPDRSWSIDFVVKFFFPVKTTVSLPIWKWNEAGESLRENWIPTVVFVCVALRISGLISINE